MFENNQHDVFRAGYNNPTDQFVFNSAFRTTRSLNYPTEFPGPHVVMYRAGNTTFAGCTFGNYSDPLPADPLERGMYGVLGIQTNVFIDRLDPDFPRNRFDNLFTGVGHASISPAYTLTIDETDFTGSARSAWIIATDNVLFTENNVNVPEAGGSAHDYGTYMYNCTGFEYEENTFTGEGATSPKAGSIFSTCGPEANEVYKNSYDGFVGTDGTRWSAGMIVSGVNRDPNTGAGITWKCNDLSNTSGNDHDIAFTDADVSVANQQGFFGSTSSPAGNTFADLLNDCSSEPAKHFYVEPGGINNFEYWHHTDEPGIEVVPDCASPPIVTTGLPGTWYHDAIVFYDPNPVTGSCTSMLSQFQPDGDLEDEIVEAENELATLREVYGDWSDGGDPEGLIDYIEDPNNDSYEVRNRMMLVAPRVSDQAWRVAFEKLPAMNPWHLAQALIANSPLTPAVIAMMEEYQLEPYFQQLVEGAQNGGISMHSIYQSEIAHFYGKQVRALRDLTARYLRSGNTADLENARSWHEGHPVLGSPQSILALSLALGDLTVAREVVDEQLISSPQVEYWEVQDLYLELVENEQGPEEVDGNGIQLLQSIASTRLYGSGQAQAWLMILGYSFEDHVVLPMHYNAMQQQEGSDGTSTTQFLDVLPNPSNGPVVIVLRLPEGIDGGVVRVLDPLGRIVIEQTFVGNVQLIELDTRQLATGVYVAEVSADDIELDKGKFELIK